MAMDLGGGKKKGVKPDINVTPLVDVVLVLLIIFMVVTPQLENDIQLDLPQILNVDPEKQKDFDPLEISLAKDGRIVIEQETFDLDSVTEYLRLAHAENPRRRLAIRADQKQKFKDIRELVGKIREAGYAGAALMVSERHSGGES